jgi:hypothetical protein
MRQVCAVIAEIEPIAFCTWSLEAAISSVAAVVSSVIADTDSIDLTISSLDAVTCSAAADICSTWFVTICTAA